MSHAWASTSPMGSSLSSCTRFAHHWWTSLMAVMGWSALGWTPRLQLRLLSGWNDFPGTQLKESYWSLFQLSMLPFRDLCHFTA